MLLFEVLAHQMQHLSSSVRITNNLSALRMAGVSAAIYQGASDLEEEEFHQGNMEIGDYAYTNLRGQSAVSNYQSLLTQITTDIVTLEILSHTPILTNTTTEITLDSGNHKTQKQIPIMVADYNIVAITTIVVLYQQLLVD